MFETFLWLFVFAVWACWRCREEADMTWYIVFRVWRVNGVLQFDELCAVLCECSTDALVYAHDRYKPEESEVLRAEACLTLAHIKRAKLLHEHTLDQVSNWSRTDFIDWMCQPAYDGDQDKFKTRSP